MRHRKNIKRLSRQSAHRKAVLRNQVKSFLVKERITTTLSLAKESRRLAEKLITLGKKNTLAARRLAFEVLADRGLVKILFSEIAPRFAARAGGYTRIIHAGLRRGDNAKLAILELTELKLKEDKPKKKKDTSEKEVKKQAGKKPKIKKMDEEEQAKKSADKEAELLKEKETQEEKGFLGGLRKFLKQDKPE
ncbi:MAG: 50S ribosomal protein L17 [Candidatus Omnitrophica bacterium]|nr:50S ribosomal protein L17 [Candidatus Omnitrophota bacterium]